MSATPPSVLPRCRLWAQHGLGRPGKTRSRPFEAGLIPTKPIPTKPIPTTCSLLLNLVLGAYEGRTGPQALGAAGDSDRHGGIFVPLIGLEDRAPDLLLFNRTGA